MKNRRKITKKSILPSYLKGKKGFKKNHVRLKDYRESPVDTSVYTQMYSDAGETPHQVDLLSRA